MLKKIKKWLKMINEAESESARAGIITVIHPFMGAYTHVDQTTYKKYINDRQKAVRKDSTES
tara:strand:+ start:3489 stop:3674 length:186 start_codon:yes stop_codon:yes gene_type:complete